MSPSSLRFMELEMHVIHCLGAARSVRAVVCSVATAVDCDLRSVLPLSSCLFASAVMCPLIQFA